MLRHPPLQYGTIMHNSKGWKIVDIYIQLLLWAIIMQYWEKAKGGVASPSWSHSLLKKVSINVGLVTAGQKHSYVRGSVPKFSIEQIPGQWKAFCYSQIHFLLLQCWLGDTVSTVANLLICSCLVKFFKRARWLRLVCYTLSRPLGIPRLISDVEAPCDTWTPGLWWQPAYTSSTTERNKHRGGFSLKFDIIV